LQICPERDAVAPKADIPYGERWPLTVQLAESLRNVAPYPIDLQVRTPTQKIPPPRNTNASGGLSAWVKRLAEVRVDVAADPEHLCA